MILQALKEYYDRKAADPESGIAPEGFEKKELQFLVVINSYGELISIEDTREKVGKRLIAKTFLRKDKVINKFNYFYSVGFDLDMEYYPLVYQGHHGNSMTSSSVIVMPTAIFTEKSSNFLNLEGLVQKANAAVSPDKLVRKD